MHNEAFEIENGYLTYYYGVGEVVEIPDCVRVIGDGSFIGRANLKKLIVPNGVEYIEGDAFFGCESLESVWMADTVKNVGSGAFAQCGAIRDLTLPRHVRLEASAFDDAVIENLLRQERIYPDNFNEEFEAVCLVEKLADFYTEGIITDKAFFSEWTDFCKRKIVNLDVRAVERPKLLQFLISIGAYSPQQLQRSIAFWTPLHPSAEVVALYLQGRNDTAAEADPLEEFKLETGDHP